MCSGFALDLAGTALADYNIEAVAETTCRRQEDIDVSLTNSPDDLAPIAASTGQTVEVRSTSMRIHELCIERPAIVAYLRSIPVDKQTIALVHALEVGVTELVARRERFKKPD